MREGSAESCKTEDRRFFNSPPSWLKTLLIKIQILLKPSRNIREYTCSSSEQSHVVHALPRSGRAVRRARTDYIGVRVFSSGLEWSFFSTLQNWQLRLTTKQRTVFNMDPRYGTPRSVDAVDPTSSYDAWPTLPSTRESRGSRCLCCRWRLSWSAVSVVEIALMLWTAVFYFFFTKTSLKHILRAETADEQVTELSEWILRMVGSLICVQVRTKIY